MDGKELTKKYWNVKETLEEKRGYYGINETLEGIELCFGKGDMKRHTFTLQYTLYDFVYNTSDSQIVYFTFFPVVTADNFEVNVSSFYSFPDTLDVWGFGYKGYAYVKDGKITMANKGELKKEYVVLLAKFPANTFKTDNTLMDYSDFNTVLNMAQEGSYKHDYSSSNKTPSWYIIIICVLGVLTPYLILYAFDFSMSMLFSSIKKSFAKKKKHSYFKGNKKINYDEVPFFREIPCNKDIYYANSLIYLNGLDYDKCNIVGAIILKWANEGKIRFIKNNHKTFSEKNGSIEFYDAISFDNDLEQSLYEKMQIASVDNILEAKELKRYCKEHYTSFSNLLDNFNTKMLEQLKNNKYIDGPIYNRTYSSIFGMNDRVYGDSIQLIGLKKYLTEFSRIDTKEVMEVKLWNEYLMFAYLFGIADKVAKQLNKLYPKEMMDLNFDYNVAQFISDITIDSFRLMETHNDITKASTNARKTVHELAAHSYSSGGGGFSSGGGGGGSIGGGGSMGGR